MLDSSPDFPNLLQRVEENYARLPAQAKHVARWLVEHPDDVALLSAREQAKSLGVAPATLTRFAQHFGFAGYDDLRRVSQRRLRARAGAFMPEARRMVARRKASGAAALAEGVVDADLPPISTRCAAMRRRPNSRRRRSFCRAGDGSTCSAAARATRSRIIFSI